MNHIGGIMVTGLASSAVDCWFEPGSGQTKTMKLVFIVSPLSTALVRTKNNISKWSDTSTRTLLFQWTSYIMLLWVVSPLTFMYMYKCMYSMHLKIHCCFSTLVKLQFFPILNYIQISDSYGPQHKWWVQDTSRQVTSTSVLTLTIIVQTFYLY